jgi:isopenicillin-N epimerase
VVGGALGLTVDEMPSAVDGLAMTVVPLPPWASTTERDVAVLRRRIYDDLRAEVAITRWNQSAFIRLSAQIYNQADEFEQLADGLPALIPAQS